GLAMALARSSEPAIGEPLAEGDGDSRRAGPPGTTDGDHRATRLVGCDSLKGAEHVVSAGYGGGVRGESPQQVLSVEAVEEDRGRSQRQPVTPMAPILDHEGRTPRPAHLVEKIPIEGGNTRVHDHG